MAAVLAMLVVIVDDAAAAVVVPAPAPTAVVLGLDSETDFDSDLDPMLIDAGAPAKPRSSTSESHPYWPSPAFQDS